MPRFKSRVHDKYDLNFRISNKSKKEMTKNYLLGVRISNFLYLDLGCSMDKRNLYKNAKKNFKKFLILTP